MYYVLVFFNTSSDFGKLKWLQKKIIKLVVMEDVLFIELTMNQSKRQMKNKAAANMNR